MLLPGTWLQCVLPSFDPAGCRSICPKFEPMAAGTVGYAAQRLGLGGKMIRDCIGTVTLAEHEDGSPVALAIMDQKEGTRRCEQSAAASLLQSLPALDGKVVTADALHCQKLTARTIVEKGGDYLLQIKANQPALLQQAQAAGAVSSPLLSTPTPDTVGSKSVA